MRNKLSITEGFGEAQAGYLAAKRAGRLKRRRRGIPALGAGADFHYQSEADYLWMGEAARDMDRNDVVVGQTVTRAVHNELQGGLDPEPNTGDEELDKTLKARWAEESIDPKLCDVQGQFTFHEQTRLISREIKVVGDIFALPSPDGPVQLLEFHRCRSPTKTKKNIVHGVELSPERKRLRYWFSKESIDPLSHQRVKVGDLKSVDAFDRDGDPNVWHVYCPTRVSQTRGVTAFAPIFDMVGMHDDVQFAELLHKQIASCFFVFRNRGENWDPTTANTDQPIGNQLPADGTSRRIEGVVPGLEMTGAKGETLTMASPQIPNAEFFPHTRLILTFIGINLGMPLVLLLLDASETNFSGYRGAVDQARLGFRANQKVLIHRWCRPSWHWRIHLWSRDDATLRRLVEQHHAGDKTVNPLRHEWLVPAWPYIEPMKDAAADLVRLSNMQASPTQVAQERGNKFSEVVDQTVRDRGEAIEKALVRAKELNLRFALEGDAGVTWRDLAPLPMSDGVTVSITGGEGAEQASGVRGRDKQKEAT